MLKTILLSFLGGAAGVYLLFALFLYFKQRSLIYFPTPEQHLPQAVHEWFDSGEARLKIWTINPGRSDALIYFGGNAEVIEENIPLYQRTLAGHTIYLVNYRGFGGSSNTPSESGLYHDALEAYRHLSKSHRAVDIAGRSLGSGVATYLASRVVVRRLVLITPYDSVLSVAEATYPMFPVRLLLKDRFESIHRMPQIASPTLVLIAGNDQVIPRKHTENLIAVTPTRLLTVTEIPDAAHNDITEYPEFSAALSRFLGRDPVPTP